MAAPTPDQVAWLAIRVRATARKVGVELPVDYSRRVVADALSCESQVAVTKLGAGVVIHTAPDSSDRLPVVVGYADADGQWYRDGRRHRADGAVSVSAGSVANEVVL
jgi:hypothetical protein